ncbi:MAG: O-methyltransferase [Halanaerobiaceae bacterium]
MSDDSFFVPARDELLLDMEEYASRNHIPIVKPEVGKFLSVLISASSPAKILEIGTAIGYSTIWMARVAGKDTEIVTIEIDEEMYHQAGENFRKAGIEKKINQKLGDALEILPYLRRKFDFVFIDAAKGQYLNYLEMIMELTNSGSIIIADNILFHGYLEKEGNIKRTKRTIVRNLQEYIDTVTDHELLNSTIISTGDGLAISVKK